MSERDKQAAELWAELDQIQAFFPGVGFDPPSPDVHVNVSGTIWVNVILGGTIAHRVYKTIIGVPAHTIICNRTISVEKFCRVFQILEER